MMFLTMFLNAWFNSEKCPSGWHHYEKTASCYKVYLRSENYWQAVETCQKVNASLATFGTNEELQFILKIEVDFDEKVCERKDQCKWVRFLVFFNSDGFETTSLWMCFPSQVLGGISVCDQQPESFSGGPMGGGVQRWVSSLTEKYLVQLHILLLDRLRKTSVRTSQDPCRCFFLPRVWLTSERRIPPRTTCFVPSSSAFRLRAWMSEACTAGMPKTATRNSLSSAREVRHANTLNGNKTNLKDFGSFLNSCTLRLYFCT